MERKSINVAVILTMFYKHCLKVAAFAHFNHYLLGSEFPDNRILVGICCGKFTLPQLPTVVQILYRRALRVQFSTSVPAVSCKWYISSTRTLSYIATTSAFDHLTPWPDSNRDSFGKLITTTRPRTGKNPAKWHRENKLAVRSDLGRFDHMFVSCV